MRDEEADVKPVAGVSAVIAVVALACDQTPTAPVPRAALSLVAGFQQMPYATLGFNPTAMEFSPDGRLFVSDQQGNLRVIKDGALLPTPFITLNVDATVERGLLGIAFDPNDATHQFVYV